MKKIKYIFIVQVTRQLCVDILNEFAKEDIDIELYTGEVSNSFNNLDTNIKVHLLCKYNKDTSFKRLFTWSWFTLQVFFKLLFKKKRNSELVFISTPPFVPFLGVFFKNVFGQNFHLIVWDLYPEALLILKNVNEKSFIYRRWKKANNNLFDKAATVITLGNHMAKAISKYFDDGHLPGVIYSWSDPQYIAPIAKADNWFANKYNQADKLTVLYSGNMGDTHDFESLLKTAESLKDHKDICFLMIGDGTKRPFIEESIKRNRLDSVILLPFQDNSVLPFSLAAGDIGIVTLDKEMGNVSVPSKTYSLLAAGNAMLALGPKDSELALILNKYNCGEIFENGDIEGISNFILSLHKDRDLLEKYKRNSRTASQNFTPLNANEYYKHITGNSDRFAKTLVTGTANTEAN